MKKLILASLAMGNLWAVTLIGAGGIGEEVDQYNASRRSMGNAGMAVADQGSFSYYNPARMAFGEKTSFSATLAGEAVKSESGDLISNDNAFGFPTFALVFSATDFAFSLAYLQTYQNNVRISDEDGNKLYESLGGLSEIVFSGSYRFFTQLGVGVGYHLASGKDRRYFSYLNSAQDWGVESEYGIFAPYTEQEIVNSGSYPSFSVHWEDRYFAISAGVQLPYEIERSVYSEVFLKYEPHWANGISDVTELDVYSVEQPKVSAKQKMPAMYTFGARYNLSRLHLLAFDFIFADASTSDTEFNSWTGLLKENAIAHQARWSLGLGYQWGASPKPFDDYFEKMALRAGLGLKQVFQGDALEWRSTAGVGLPLGSRGATLDMGFHYGNRFGEGTASFDEQFAGFSLTFTGFGNWGEPSRRYR